MSEKGCMKVVFGSDYLIRLFWVTFIVSSFYLNVPDINLTSAALLMIVAELCIIGRNIQRIKK